jgi:hypothetical protein
VVDLLYRVSLAQSELGGSEETADRIDSLSDPRTMDRWRQDADRLRQHVRRHDALLGAPVAVVDRHAASALSAVLAIVERAAGLVALQDWYGLYQLEWGISQSELLARLDGELAALASRSRRGGAKREPKRSTDFLACSAVESLEKGGDLGWSVADVVRQINSDGQRKVTDSALLGRYGKDKKPRCPEFMLLWERAKRRRAAWREERLRGHP